MKLITLALGGLLLLGGFWHWMSRIKRSRRKTVPSTVSATDLYALAVEHHKAGRLEKTEAALREAIQAQPDYPEAWNRLGNLFKETGCLNEAEAAYHKALAYPNAWLNLGNLLVESGRIDEGEAAYRGALQAKPDFVQAYNNLGGLLRFLDRADEAEATFRQALAIQPDFPEALNNLGILLIETQRLTEAEVVFRKLLEIVPDDAEIHNNLGILLQKAGRFDEAEASFQDALRLQPDYAEVHHNLAALMVEAGQAAAGEANFRQRLRQKPSDIDALKGLAVLLSNTDRTDEAEAVFQQILKITPDSADTLNNLGTLLSRRAQWQDAEVAFRQALSVQQDPETYRNLGALLRENGRNAEAEAAYRQALSLQANHHDIQKDLANLLLEDGRTDEAKAVFEQALAHDPTDIKVLENRGYLDLTLGDYGQGWAGYEHRWASSLKPYDSGFPQPLWDGKPFVGKTLLIHCEQGAGDSLQFFRYLPEVARQGGNLTLRCPASLFRLFSTSLPPGTDIVQEIGALPEFDLHCPLMSLPFRLDTRLETIPAEVPYLRVPKEATATCPRLPTRPDAPLKVGLVWAGNPAHNNDSNRSVDFKLLEPLFDVPGITWVILQKERRPPGFAALARQRGWLDPITNAKDFADTAAVIRQLDLVIGVDTSVMHLAGALGKPSWLLLPIVPDWRWLLGRDDNPWYPTMRLFRQPRRGDWPTVVRRVADSLSETQQTRPLVEHEAGQPSQQQ